MLRGARQVGKSWAVEHLGEKFDYFIEVNFEKRPEMLDVFQKIHDVHELTANLSMYYNTPVIPGRMLRALELIPADSEIDIYWIRAELRYIRSRSVKPSFTGPYSRMC